MSEPARVCDTLCHLRSDLVKKVLTVRTVMLYSGFDMYSEDGWPNRKTNTWESQYHQNVVGIFGDSVAEI